MGSVGSTEPTRIWEKNWAKQEIKYEIYIINTFKYNRPTNLAQWQPIRAMIVCVSGEQWRSQDFKIEGSQKKTKDIQY